MAPRLLRRRALTAAGVYASVVLGVLASVVAARELGTEGFGDFVVVVAAAGFFQSLLDLTAEEALTKMGFRYLESGQHGRLRRLFRRAVEIKAAGGVLAFAVLAALSPLAGPVFGDDTLVTPLLLAALIPLVQSTENVAMTAFLLHGRYDLRGAFQSASMALRLAGVAVGAQYGVTETVLGIVAGQALSTAAVSVAGRRAFLRLPRAASEPLGEDLGEIVRFVLRSSGSTAVVSLRSMLAPPLLGAVSTTTQAGFLRVAQAPVVGFTAISSPVRLIQLTEHTRSWERGDRAAVIRGVRRYTLISLAVAAPTLPLFYWLMPDLVRIAFGSEYLPAAGAARIALFAALITLVFGWTKPFPVAIGRPGLRITAHAIESAVLLPLVAVLGARSGVDGAAWALLASSGAFALFWVVAFARITRTTLAVRAEGGELAR